MLQLFEILFAAGFTFAVCFSAGKLVLQMTRVRLTRMEEFFVSFIAGAAILSTLVLALTAAGQANRGVFLAAGLLVIGLAIRRRAFRFAQDPEPAALSLRWRTFFAVAYGTFGILYLASALLPETSADGTAYHVAYAARYLREHHLSRILTNFTANYPEGMEMLFLFAFAFGKHSAAAMVHFLFLLMGPVGMFAYGRRISAPLAGAAGGLLFFLSPIVGRTGTVAYVDVALATTIFAVFLLLEIWRSEAGRGVPVLIGLCAGFAFAIKYTGGLAIVYAVGAVAYHLFRTHKPAIRQAIIVAAFALFIAAPWLIKNAVFTGNPVSPFANAIFPNRYVSVWLEKLWTVAQREHSGVAWPAMPRELTVGGGRLYGVVGPVFVLTPLLLAILGRPSGRRVAFAALFFALPCLLAPETRYWLPALIFASLGIALAAAQWPRPLAAVLVFHFLTCWPALVNRYVDPYTWRIREINWKAALRRTPEADYIRTQLVDYDIGLMLDRVVPAREPVFSFSGIQQAYHKHPIIVEWTSSFGIRVSEILRAPFTRSLEPTRRYDYRFSPTQARKFRIVQTERSNRDRWSISELRVFARGVELPRSPEWRLRASSNPWDVQLAFDNSPVTRWTSYAAYQPGMFVEIDFETARTIDEVTADCTPDQEGMNMRVEYESTDGQWHTLSDRASMTDVAPPEAMRRAAIQEVGRDGVHWLLVHDDERDRGASDFNRYQRLWGIELIATEGRYKLYRLE